MLMIFAIVAAFVCGAAFMIGVSLLMVIYEAPTPPTGHPDREPWETWYKDR